MKCTIIARARLASPWHTTRCRSSASPPNAAPLSLPADLVTRILQHASQQDSQTAARVCSSWMAASLRATTDLSVTECGDYKLLGFVDWLSKHQHSLNHLTSLQLERPGGMEFYTMPQLPCSHLRQLQLSVSASPYLPRLLPPATLQTCAGSLTTLAVKGEGPK